MPSFEEPMWGVSKARSSEPEYFTFQSAKAFEIKYRNTKEVARDERDSDR